MIRERLTVVALALLLAAFLPACTSTSRLAGALDQSAFNSSSSIPAPASPTSTPVPTPIPTPTPTQQLSVAQYGAVCDGHSDDSAAFQAAVTAAQLLYVKTNLVTQVTIPPNCVVNSIITIGSGVMIEGPGPVLVPNQTHGLFLFSSADNSGIENTTITVGTNPNQNDASLYAVRWQSADNDKTNHKNFIARNNTINIPTGGS